MAINARCDKCHGTGWNRVETSRGLAAERCQCYRDEVKDARYLKLGLPPRVAKLSFDNFSAGDYFKERAKHRILVAAMNTAKSFADEYPLCKRKGLLFHGGPVTQMTHLAVATLKRFIDRGFDCMFCDYQLLLETLIQRSDRDSATAASSKEFARRVLDVDVLLIDSLGEHRRTGWTTDLIGGVIKHRYFHERCLLATTGLSLHLSIEGMQHQMTSEARYARQKAWPDTLSDRIGQESFDRLSEHCEKICITVPELAAGAAQTMPH